MSNLVYIPGNEDIGFAIAKAALPAKSSLSLTEFSDIVSRDTRIPSRYNTVVGHKIEDGSNELDYRHARLWLPHGIYSNSLGVALVPRAMASNMEWVGDIYAYGFQGLDEQAEIYFGGLHGYNNHNSTTMLLISSGLKRTPTQLERVLEEFFEKTGLEKTDIDERERAEFDEGYQKVIDVMKQLNIHERGGFMYVALVSADVGEKLMQVAVVDLSIKV